MRQDVKPLSRRERALATRARILDAAAIAFAERGYAGTTMVAIANAANVAVQTVYLVFHTKPELLIETIAQAAWAGDRTRPDARSWIAAAAEADDPGLRLAIAVDGGVEIYRRAARLFPVLAEASATDPDVARAWQRIVDERRSGMLRMAALMAARGELRPGVSADVATDVLVGLHRHELYLAFTRECGWTDGRFKAWLFRALCRELLAPKAAERATGPGSPAVLQVSFASDLGALE